MKLRAYQEKAIDFLKRNPIAGLFIDMGLGKTAATLHALVDLPGPTLLVGPIRVIENVWMQEAVKWPETSKLSFSLIRGSVAARKRALEQDVDIYLVNPELLEEALLARPYANLVVEESSMFKNPSTKRFKLLRKHLAKFDRRVILTGTPTPNSLMDLWSQVFILDRGQRLETAFFRFKNRYFRQTDYMGFKFEPVDGANEHVTKLVSDIIFRVEAKGNLPARQAVRNEVQFSLPRPAQKIYNDLEKHALAELTSATISAASAGAALMKLRQVASGFVYNDDRSVTDVHDEKIKAVKEIIEQTGSPVIVVYQFQHELAALRKALPHGVMLDQGWNQKQWDRGEIPLLFLHPGSGGHGLNLQYGCHTMAIFSASFSYEQMSQTMARIDRQGQEFPVVFHFLIARDTVDELILSVLDRKATTQANVLSMVRDYANAQVNRR
jgi:SNF2 family DNA or RNA helicase